MLIELVLLLIGLFILGMFLDFLEGVVGLLIIFVILGIIACLIGIIPK